MAASELAVSFFPYMKEFIVDIGNNYDIGHHYLHRSWPSPASPIYRKSQEIIIRTRSYRKNIFYRERTHSI
jgi:hypothetical protein